MNAEVKNHSGRPALYIDGKVCTSPVAMISTRTKSKDGDPLSFNSEYFSQLGKAGIKIYLISCNTAWSGKNTTALFDREARLLLDAVPDAYIIARFGLHPSAQWADENPDECALYSDGTKTPVHIWTESHEEDLAGFYSLSSSKWREDAGKMLADAWKEVMALPYADRIIGCMPTAGGTSEWYYIPSFLNHENKTCLGYSKAFRLEFSAYLKETYSTDENLQKHWKMPNVSIADPPIPTYEQYYFAEQIDTDIAIRPQMLSNAPVPPAPCNGTNKGSFIDFESNPVVYDFLRAWHLGTAKSQIHFAKVIKEITPNKIVGFCYGAQGNIRFVYSGTNGGTRSILESEYIDFIENPSVYQNRQPGGFVGQRVVQDSFALHNKLYLCQDDTRTLAENSYYKSKYGVYDMVDSLNILKREFGKAICEDMPHWWFDQLVGGKRFNYPEVLDLFSKQQEICDEAFSLDRKKKSDVALIFSEETFQAVSYQTSCDAVNLLRNYEIARIGTGVDQYYHNDMANPDMPSYKLYIFVNTYVLSSEEQAVIQKKLREDHAVAVWMYAPGYVDPMSEDKMSVKAMSGLTGMHMEMICDSFDPTIRFDGEDHPVTALFDSRQTYGRFAEQVKNNFNLSKSGQPHDLLHFDSYLYPLFYVHDDDAAVLAHFAVNGLPAVALKECDGYTSIYYGPKYIEHTVLRNLAKYAGAHIWCETDDVTYVGRNYITFHAASGGTKTLRFPTPVTVTEVYEGKCYGENVTEITFPVHMGETKMFRFIE